MAQQQQISASQRASLFARATRQTFQTLPKQKATSEFETIQFTLPKSRLLSKILLEVEAVATLKGTNTNFNLSAFHGYEAIRKITVDMNNGFSPFVLSGRDAFLYSSIRQNPDVLLPADNTRAISYVEQTGSSTGKDNKIKFLVQLPITLNERDPIGIVLLQNEETSVTVSVDIGELKSIYKTVGDQEVTFKSLEITPLLETFTIPPIPEARPDLSVLKIVQSHYATFEGNGQEIIKLPTGTIYRKLALYFEDENGQPLSDSDITSNIEMVFNTADTPYSIKPSLLASKNHTDLGYPLPAGVYVFDFSFNGIANMGGTRDYIDTEKLTEFWVRFTTNKKGKVTIVRETLSRLL